MSWNIFSFICLLGMFVLFVVFECSEESSGNEFKVSHNCKEIGVMDGSFNFNGGYISGKIGFRCDDGKEYWKNK